MSSASNTGYTAMRSPGPTRWAKSTDSPFTRITSISVCGTPTDSITSLTAGVPAISHAKLRWRRAGATKSLSSA